MDVSCWPAPAKLNLFLHITGRRADGYHLLQTVFQLLDVGDEIRLRLRDDGKLKRINDLPGVAEADDLVIRAARALQLQTGCELGADIEVDKRLPMGGGVGGGSSDAATVLVALNRLWGTELSVDQLAEIGVRLGADVPVFIRGHSAWAEGVGEHLEAVELPSRWYLVVSPGVSVSTAEIFTASELTRDCTPITIRAFLSQGGGNVCESVVVARYPQVGEMLDWLADLPGAVDARMTGTGACAFAAFDDESKARDALADLPKRWQGFVARGVNRSPLLEALNKFE